MKARRAAEIKKIPCIFPVYREFVGRDRFASDCAHHQDFQALGDLAEREKKPKT
jgi:hypothetical protein